MTENKAIEWLRAISATQNQSSHSASLSDRKEALYMAIQALEKQSMVNEILHELREYSAIGTIEEFKALKLGRLGNKGFITIGQTMEEYAQKIRENAIDECIKIIEETVWRDTDMLVDNIRELKGGAE